MPRNTLLPQRFCWTKFGSEAGEPIDAIIARKERERIRNGGVFLWGIGNSVAPGVRRLVEFEETPQVVFSPMISQAKAVDAHPAEVVRWQEARDLNGRRWPLPEFSLVTSRAHSGLVRPKKVHYALVCTTAVPLTDPVWEGEIDFNELTNLESGTPLGFSQVTSIVARGNSKAGGGKQYRIGFMATLTSPYFVELGAPVTMGGASLVSLTVRSEPQPLFA
jgi:hypothetical protein